ncbi:MAG TPA: protein phosphatase 2C domain-containing protein [Candidatus Methylomirabilis sp.]|nr:protein phosphatase 2C domain-containing protein [Candidatus Methylomirabilis sp.]
MPTLMELKSRTVEIEFFHLTDAGTVREVNEDSIGFWRCGEGFLLAVADGLGGHNSGEVASALALEVMAREMARAPGTGPLMRSLKRAAQQANLEIYQKSITVPDLHGMGTTLTASLIAGNTLVAAHIGDSRLYLFRNGVLSQLTKDHTSVQDQVAYGILSPEEARTHPDRHKLTNYLGHDLITAVDTLKMDIQSGDVLVQCSDGIHDVISESEMTQLLHESRPEDVCRAAVQRSRDAGGFDNMSLQVAAVVSCAAPPPSASWWRFWH